VREARIATGVDPGDVRQTRSAPAASVAPVSWLAAGAELLGVAARSDPLPSAGRRKKRLMCERTPYLEDPVQAVNVPN